MTIINYKLVGDKSHDREVFRNGESFGVDGVGLDLHELLGCFLEEELDSDYGLLDPKIEADDEFEIGDLTKWTPAETTFEDINYLALAGNTGDLRYLDIYTEDEFICSIFCEFIDDWNELCDVIAANQLTGIEEGIFLAEEMGMDIIREWDAAWNHAAEFLKKIHG